MARITYNINDNEIREANEITFNFPDDINIYEFKTICVRLAHSLGYHPNSIDKSFGDLEDEPKEELKRRLNQLKNK